MRLDSMNNVIDNGKIVSIDDVKKYANNKKFKKLLDSVDMASMVDKDHYYHKRYAHCIAKNNLKRARSLFSRATNVHIKMRNIKRYRSAYQKVSNK